MTKPSARRASLAVLLAVMFASVAGLVQPALASPPVTFGGSAQNNMGCVGLAPQVMDVPIVIGVATNRVVVVFISTVGGGAWTDIATFNGAAMIPLTNTGALGVFQYSFYLFAPAVGAGNFHVDTTGSGNRVEAAVVEWFSGVNAGVAPVAFDVNGFGPSPLVLNSIDPTSAGLLVSSMTVKANAGTPVNVLTGGGNDISVSYLQAACLKTIDVETLPAVAGNTAVDWTSTDLGAALIGDAQAVLLTPPPSGGGTGCVGSCSPPQYFIVVLPPTIVQCGSVVLSDNRTQASNAILYSWDFGDGSPLEQTTSHSVSHTYATGEFQASVRVQDAGGAVSSYDVSVAVPSSSACVVGTFVEQYASVFAATALVFLVALGAMYLRKEYNTRLFRVILGATVVLVSLIVLYVATIDVIKLAVLSTTSLAGGMVVFIQVSGYGKRLQTFLIWYGLVGAVLVAALFFR